MSKPLKRDEIKYIRDLVKSEYQKGTECYICGSTEELQLHHFYSVTQLWEKWKRENKIGTISSVDEIFKLRGDFKEYAHKEIYEDVVTLCKFHHMDHLHRLFGKSPSLSTAEKQRRWVERQREKRK